MHDIKEKKPEENHERLICVICGAELSSSDTVCHNCGATIEDDYEESGFFNEEPYSLPVAVSITRTDTGEKIDIELSGGTIGRGSKATYRIDGNPYIGRQHIRVFQNKGCVYIEDLNSKNKTYVNDTQIKEVVEVHDGDVIKLADEDFELSIDR